MIIEEYRRSLGLPFEENRIQQQTEVELNEEPFFNIFIKLIK
mgnify:CR=1 FL=1